MTAPTFGHETPERVIGRVLSGYAAVLRGNTPSVVARTLALAAGHALDGWSAEDVQLAITDAAEGLRVAHDAGKITDAGHAANSVRVRFLAGLRAGVGSKAPVSSRNLPPGSDTCRACGRERGQHEMDCPVRAEKMERLAETIHLRRAVKEMNDLRPKYNPLREARIAAIEAWRNDSRLPKPLWAFWQYESPEAYVRARRIACGLEPLPEIPAQLRDAPPPSVGDDFTDPTDDYRPGDPSELGAVVLGIEPDELGIVPLPEEREELAP